MKLKKLLTLGCAAFTIFASSSAFAYYVELRANNKTDYFQMKIVEGWVVKSDYFVMPHSTIKETMFWDVASNLHVFYKGPADADFVEFPACGGGDSYWTTLTVTMENPTEGSAGIPVCSII